MPLEDMTLKEHGKSWFTVVTETEMSDRVLRITEKPMKALVDFHPLILFGNPGSLKLIRDLGFETFQGFFDEAYDEEMVPRKRFDMAYAQVERLCRMDEAELARLENGISEALIHNARWGLTKLPGVYLDRLDVALFEDILAAVGLGQPVTA